MSRRQYRRYPAIGLCIFAAFMCLIIKWYSKNYSNAACFYASSVYRAMQLDNLKPILVSVNAVDKTECEESTDVPNVVHYVWFGYAWNLTFLNYLSFLSVHRILSPDFILIHGGDIPVGYWWNQTIHDVANIYYVYREPSLTALNGEPFKYGEHLSDLARLQIVLSKKTLSNYCELQKFIAARQLSF